MFVVFLYCVKLRRIRYIYKLYVIFFINLLLVIISFWKFLFLVLICNLMDIYSLSFLFYERVNRFREVKRFI